MSFADFLLLACCVLWTVGVLFGLRRQQRFLIGFMVAAALGAALQAAANEFRWQMVPAYVFLLLATVSAALAVSSTPAAPGPGWRRVLARVLLVAVAVAVVALPVWLFPRITYPRPTGPYAVGVRSEYWVDSSRADPLAPDPTQRRRLLVEIWYPADVGPESQRVQLHPDPDALAKGLASDPSGRMPVFLFSGLGRGLTWAYRGVPVTAAERSFPLLVFSHGFGGTRVQNGFEMAELASHGYVIASVEHTYHATGTVFPDGSTAPMDPSSVNVLKEDSTAVRMVNIWAADGRFVIDRMFALDRADPRLQLGGRLDTLKVGYFGHSFGGATAAQVMSLDPRVLTGINMDGYLAGTAWVNGLDRPFLQFRSDPFDYAKIPEAQLKAAGITRESLKRLVQDWQARTVRVLQGGGLEVHIRGTAHMNYSDMPLWSPVVSRMTKQAGPIPPRRAHAIIDGITLAWFDHYLKGRPAGILSDLKAAYPEVDLTGSSRSAP